VSSNPYFRSGKTILRPVLYIELQASHEADSEVIPKWTFPRERKTKAAKEESSLTIFSSIVCLSLWSLVVFTCCVNSSNPSTLSFYPSVLLSGLSRSIATCVIRCQVLRDFALLSAAVIRSRPLYDKFLSSLQRTTATTN
jgi:hypothetical protein